MGGLAVQVPLQANPSSCDSIPSPPLCPLRHAHIPFLLSTYILMYVALVEKRIVVLNLNSCLQTQSNQWKPFYSATEIK